MRYPLATLLLLHGLLHLLGFLKAWGLAALPQMSGRTLLPVSGAGLAAVGVLWLVVAVALLVAAATVLRGWTGWWMVATPALVLSQALIIFQWNDAWAGTLANVILAVAVVMGAASARFHEDTARLARLLLDAVPVADARILRTEELAHLPPPVRRWLEASHAVGQPRARTVRLRQGGGMRTAANQAYAQVRAEQYFTTDRPGFVWSVDVTMMGVPVVGRDTFRNAHGRMLIKAGGVVTVADGTGPTFDLGTAQRFLGEIVWFPSAAVTPHIRWKALDERQAEATLTLDDLSASVTFDIDERGRVVRISANRYYDGRLLERWEIPITAWATIRGIEMPVRGGAVWKLASGDFDYFQWEILDVETNTRKLWSE